MSRNAFLNNISQSYVKNFISKNVSKISETPISINSKRIKKINKLSNIKNRNKSTTLKELNNISNLMKKEKTLNPLITVYNNAFFPRSYKNKNYIKEMKNCLPPITINNEYSSSKVLMTDYESTLNKFNNIYNIKINDIENNKDSDEDEYIIDKIKNNKINFNETTYIEKVLKDNQKQNLFVHLNDKEEFSSPKNSLLTLKINKDLIKKISEKISKYQYQRYVNKINQSQVYKLKLCIMPKTSVRELKYNLEMNKQKEDKSKEIKNNPKKGTILNKVLINKIAKKFSDNKTSQEGIVKNSKDNKKISKSDIYLKITEQNIQDGDKKNTINSTLIRNALILDVNIYYCKYLKQGINNPNSRIEATFTPYLNNLFLFGGLQSNEVSDLWELDTTNKIFSWKKKIFEKEINYNPRYGHTTVLFNDCLYIYGGKLNLKQLKYPLEDILVYNISLNTMKIGSFKNEKNTLSRKYIYIPFRRNHIAHVIGWNMIVHGGIDISKENISNNQEFFIDDVNNYRKNMEYKINEKINNCPMLGDFMALDLTNFKWMNLTNIVQKKRNSKKLFHFKNLPRAYHSSCLVLSQEHIIKGNKLNIYKNDLKNEVDSNFTLNGSDSKSNFDIKYEGIYIFGGIDENLNETNNLFILHCFRNPLVLFEPKINGMPPTPRQMATMNFNKILNYITIYGGKSINQVFGDLFILDIMNFQWINVRLFGASIIQQISGHSAGIINDKLYIFGGSDGDNKYISAKLLCIELDLFRNKKLSKIYEYASEVLKDNPKDKTAKNVLELIKGGADLPPDIYPFLQLDN